LAIKGDSHADEQPGEWVKGRQETKDFGPWGNDHPGRLWALKQPKRAKVAGWRPTVRTPFLANFGCDSDATFRRASEHCVVRVGGFGISAHIHAVRDRCRSVILDFNRINILGWAERRRKLLAENQFGVARSRFGSETFAVPGRTL